MDNITNPGRFQKVNAVLDQIDTDLTSALQIYATSQEIKPLNIVPLPFDWHPSQLKLLEQTKLGRFQKIYNTRMSYVSYTKLARLSGRAIIDTDNNVNKDSLYHYFNQKVCIAPSHTHLGFSIDEPVFYIGSTRSYYHWIMDCLSSLYLWKALGLEKKVRLLVTDVTDFKKETLKAYGVPDEAIIENKNTQLNLKNVFIPSIIGGGQAWAPMLFLPEFHRSSVHQIQASQNEGKYYISRSRTKSRPMNNEKEVETLLSQRGFEILFLEDYSFIQQVQLMKSASFVIAPHGAGLTNIVYCQPGTHIVELLCETYLNTCFHLLSGVGGLLYTPLVSSEYEVTGQHLHDHNWSVNTDQLKELISHFGK